MNRIERMSESGTIEYLGCGVYAHLDGGNIVIDLRWLRVPAEDGEPQNPIYPAHPIAINRDVLANLVAFAARVWPEQENKP